MISDPIATRTNTARTRLLQARRGIARASGAQRVARALHALGLSHVYVVGGNPVDPLIGACAKMGIRAIGARHQQGACLMSLAHNYVAGALHSAVVISPGPAATNCATGVLWSHDNGWPLMVIAGRFGSDPQRPGAFQDFDAAGLFEPLLHYGTRVRDPARIESELRTAAAASVGARPGPAWVDIDAAVLEHMAPMHRVDDIDPHAAARVRAQTDPDPDAIASAAQALAIASRPMLLIGDALRWSAPWAVLRRLVERLGTPFACTSMARGYLPDGHPLCVNAHRAAVLSRADLVVLLGTRLDWTQRHGAEIAPNARIIRIDHTPAQAPTGRGPAIEILGDIGAILERIECCLESTPAIASRPPIASGWIERPAAAAPRPDPSAQTWRDDDRGLPCAIWLNELAPAIPGDAMTILDGNITMNLAQRALPATWPLGRLTAGANGNMGIGIPFAIGASLACPQRPVVLVTGDFAFGINAFEMETAIRYGLPIIAVVSNNRGPGGSTRQQQIMRPQPADPALVHGESVRYDLLVEALGGIGRHVEHPGQIADAFRALALERRTACIDVRSHDADHLVASL